MAEMPSPFGRVFWLVVVFGTLVLKAVDAAMAGEMLVIGEELFCSLAKDEEC